MARRPSIPIACTLGPDDAVAQLGEWTVLQGELVHSEPVPGGYRLVFPAGLADQVRDLARREAGCCAFLDLEVTAEAHTVAVTITSPDPQAMPVIELLAGR
ncbi:MAG: hypothetical protein OES57_08290 [Acidimicrobiia bacterium]|nr:hypothetical protein [Acidimicrobiia bacterium]